MRGNIKSVNSGVNISISTQMGSVYSGDAHSKIPSNWQIGDEVDFDLGPKSSAGAISNKGVSIPWKAKCDQGNRILDPNP